jgi:hypothetical protein
MLPKLIYEGGSKAKDRRGELVAGVYPNLWKEMKKRAKAEFPSSDEIYDSFYGL